MEELKTVENRKVHPYVRANILSKLFFTFLFPLFKKGYKQNLSEEDLCSALKEHESGYLGDRLTEEWEKQLKKNPKNPSLTVALWKVFGHQLIILGLVFMFIEIFVRLSAPLLLNQLLNYYDPDTTMTKTEAYYYAFGLAGCAFVSATFQHTYMLNNFHLGMKIRVATSTLIYRKALKLSKSALAETTVGQMVNLISNDVGRFEMATNHIHNLWLAPLETLVALGLLYYFVGPTGLIGVGLMVMFVPFQMWMGKKTSVYRLATAIRTDERIRLMNEIISGIQVIKMYTWEKPFAKLVELSRRKEIDQIKKISIIRAIMMSFNMFLNSAAIYVCILTYVLMGNTLDAHYVYLLQSFYGILRFSLTMFLPQGIAQVAEASVSVKRIRSFLLYEEVDFDSSSNFFNSNDNITNGSIRMKNASIKWSKTNILNDLNMDVGSQELACIIGPVGSGKTTLLHGILGELRPISGTINVKGSISYASQEPWLFVGSVRQNITFGQKFDARKYHEVIRVCQLQRDFNLFSCGDKTIVGERGVSLSGGQRARINLARAVYKEADIYLLDDPLSAVDAHVGKQMFEECITGYLKDKCVVLVTHQLQYLKHVPKIYLLGNKKIEHSGNYEEIQGSGKNFTKLLDDLKEIIDEENEIEQTIDDDEKIPIKLIRRLSTKELIPENDDKTPEIEKESREGGKISWNVYKSYFKAGGHWCKVLTLFITFVITQAISSGLDYYLKIWVNMNQIKRMELDAILKFKFNDTSINNHTIFEDFWLSKMQDNIVVITYSVLIGLVIILTIGRSLTFYRFCNKASIRLHNNMFYKIVYATMRFFNTNPSGRILNRFSKDMNQVDEVLPLCLLDSLQIALNVVAISLVVASVNSWMLIPTVVILIIFYFLRIFFLATSRDLKRLEGITRSPVYSHLTASLQGLTTIRAFGAQGILKTEFDVYQDTYSSAFFMFLAANRTFGFWLDMHCMVFIAVVTLSFLFFDTEIFGGSVGLAITQAVNLSGMFQWGMRQWCELENTMTCVERIKEYADVVPERDTVTKNPPKSWPQEGNVRFDNLSLAYANGEDYVLKNLSFEVKSTEKVGIVGRTGAGKSSIIMALFRLAINEGRIIIDNVDISKVSFTKLRSSISIIPQEPVLFSGTLRKNLDPFDEYTDKAIWSALEEVELKSAISNLESRISEGGSNFSVGQRQLICLARAIIRKSKILVLDEATANVDPQTDVLIQKTIRSKFSNFTVLTIAHRLHTIMDSDKVLVMDAGRVVEFGHPHELLQNKANFYELVQQTGKSMAENLSSIAKEAYINKTQFL
ncbi:unnamed protein product [Ceutorhynchus assimilis]|uniref:Multidrug resistance-associated protein lethal(2)03659 n=1 Tax=Ceutorhynchus assimilis TaxID=467358 RepID=A0A9N9QQN6_9CUCU|nr:unnamed protein product [Ceutorhynchus assimilis]